MDTLQTIFTEQIEAILAHELAHIKRHDYLANILQTMVEILGFYHPAVWWISRQMRVERENCCDDLAVRLCQDRLCYAKALTAMEEIRGSQSAWALAASGGNLLNRIRRLLTHDIHVEEKPNWLPSVLAMLMIISLILPTALALNAEKTSAYQAPQVTSRVDDHGRLIDKVDYPFLSDPEVIGGWKSVDFVKNIEDFDPTKKHWQGDLWLNHMIFEEGGRMAALPLTWTRGLVLGDDTASKYIIRKINNDTYLFFEWKSGDYTYRYRKPSYYVLKKVDEP